MKSALVLLAPGFEEMEAVTMVDVLRRGGIRVRVAGLEAGVVSGSRGVKVEPDLALDDVEDAKEYDAIVLPGGMRGTEALRGDARVRDLLLWYGAQPGRVVAAICAAPLVLDAHGLLEGRRYTCYPGVEGSISGGEHRPDRVVADGDLLTSRGPGTAIDFALALVERLMGGRTRSEVARGLLHA